MDVANEAGSSSDVDRLSDYLVAPNLAPKRCIYGYGYYRTRVGNAKLGIERPSQVSLYGRCP